MYTVAAVAKDASRFDLNRSVVCRGLSQQAARPLMAISSLHRKAPGEILFAEVDEADGIYEVFRGIVRLYKLLPDGRRLITAFLSAGHLLGLAMGGGVCVFTAEAITDVTLCRYKRMAFERLLDEVPGLAKRLLAVTSDELCATQERMLLLGRKSAVEKVASFLVLMAGQQGDDADEVAIPMTRSDIADYLGLTISTVSRTLTKLIRQRVIAIPTANLIEIRDRDDLEQLAAGEADADL